MSGPARWALSPLDCRAHLRAGEPPPGVLTARCGGVLPTVGVQYGDRPSGSLVCPVCADIADGGDPIAGWPPVELPLSPLAPGGQPVPSHARETPVRSGALPAPRRCSPSWAPWWPAGSSRSRGGVAEVGMPPGGSAAASVGSDRCPGGQGCGRGAGAVWSSQFSLRGSRCALSRWGYAWAAWVVGSAP